MFKILFAQSDPTLVQLYVPRLSLHFSVDSASDGLTALRKIRIAKPGLVVSDYHLPQLSGLALLKFLRSQAEYSFIPFIFLAHFENTQSALNLGANDWLDMTMASPDSLIERIYRQVRLNQRLLSRVM